MPKNSNATKSPGHKTSTTSLALIVIFVGLVTVAALSLANPQKKEALTDSNQTNQLNNQSAPQLTRNHLKKFPAGLPVVDAAVREFDTSNTKGSQQHILRLDTKEKLSDLLRSFNSWAETSDYEVIQMRENGDNATIIAGSTGARFFILLSKETDFRRVELNHVTI
jgi:hypothetical protein